MRIVGRQNHKKRLILPRNFLRSSLDYKKGQDRGELPCPGLFISFTTADQNTPMEHIAVPQMCVSLIGCRIAACSMNPKAHRLLGS